MLGHPASRRAASTVLLSIFLLVLTLGSVASNLAYAGGVTRVTVSPGKDDLTLGTGFPTFGSVKLSYPNSSILTNSVGDLLFTVTLNPLMLNTTSAQVFFPLLPTPEVQMWGSGFSSSDTNCALSGPFVAITCVISGGILTGSFNVPDARAGVYTITATGSPAGDTSSTTFTILPPSLIFNPSSGPSGTPVSVSGLGYYSTDGPCTLTLAGVMIPGSSCGIAGGQLTGSFTLTGSPGIDSVAVTTTGTDTGEAVASFTVTSSSQFVSLTSHFGPAGTVVSLSAFPFSGGFASDTTCTLSGSIVPGNPPCTIFGGIPAASFTVNNVPPGVYTVTVKGVQTGDSARASFQVLPSVPPSIPISMQVSIDIYIPPDFSGLALSKAWTSFSNSYDPHIFQVSRQSGGDRIAPNWWRVTVSNILVTHDPSHYPTPLVEHGIFLVNQTQYIRLFQVTSPSIAGRYFFKAFINGASIPVGDYPTLVVKASRDPAYISGSLRELGDRNLTNAGRPIFLPNGYGAQVLATGVDYLGRSVSAQTFINSTSDGNYTLFGVAPGTYNITAYAAGYVPTILRYTVSVAATQSLEGVDIYMTRSAIVNGTVLSENHNGALIPWGSLVQVNVGGFSRVTNHSISVKILNLDGSVVASTPAPYGITTFTDNKTTSFHFSIQRELGYDGRIPQEFANYTSGLSWGDYLLQAFVTSYVQIVEVRIHITNETTDQFAVIPLIRTGSIDVNVHFRNSKGTIGEDATSVSGTLSVSAYDMQGVLRAQDVAFVSQGATNATVELVGFSSARSFGSFSLFSSNYGLLPGTYYIRARFTSAPIIAGFANLPAPLPSTLVAGDLYYQTRDILATVGWGPEETEISFPMYKAGGILLTISSIDDESPAVRVPWRFRGATMSIMLIPVSQHTIYQTNTTQPSLVFGGQFPQTLDQTFPLNITGLKADQYDVFIQTLGYTQEQIITLNVVLGGDTDVSVRLIENPVIELTLNFMHENLLTFINSTQPYAQPIDHIDGTPTRIEVFDNMGNFVAANVTYVPNGWSGNVSFTLAGFNIYYGNPRLIWSGFYDTTDASRQSAGGLFLYPWPNEPRLFTIRVWVDGYYQISQLQVTVPPRENVSLVQSMDRASRIHGIILGPDYYDVARPLSWATITLQPDNDTLSRIIDVRPGNYTTSSLDGSFQLWAPEGTYGMGATLAGYASYSTKLEVPTGSDISVYIWLDNYNTSLMATNTSVSAAQMSLIAFCSTPSYATGSRFAPRPSECSSASSHNECCA